MIKVVSIAKVRELESGQDTAQLMENAGRASAERALEIIASMDDARVTVLVGPGNNGGDGLVAGRIIAKESSAQVRFYLLTRRDDDLFKPIAEAGLHTAYAEDDQQYRVLRNLVASADLVIDALFGIGLKLPVRDEAAKVLRNVNKALSEVRTERPARGSVNPAQPLAGYRRRQPYVIALDCPSGLNGDTGEMDQQTIHADETIAFIAAKPGLLQFPGAAAVGHLRIAPIGVEADRLKEEPVSLVDADLVLDLLPKREVNSHKGTYGRALIVAGSINYTGAAGLAAQAAYRIGAGLVTVGAPHPVAAALAAQISEPTWLLLPHDLGVPSEAAAPIIRAEYDKVDALLFGPGWGQEDTTRELLLKLLEKTVETGRRKRGIGFLSAGEADKSQDKPGNNAFPPLVLDADALNLLSSIDNWWTRVPANTIITPHPGEMARLIGKEIADVQADRLHLVQTKAAEWNVILLLKGAHTVVAAPDGRTAILPFKTDALAKAGTGDVLAGMIAGLLAQGLAPYDAAVASAYLHGLAGQLAAEWLGSSRSVMASDVINAIPEALGTIEG